MKTTLPVVGLSLLLAACGTETSYCEEPVDGSRSDVTLEFEHQAGFTVTECPDPLDSEGAFLVRGTASDRLFSGRAPEDLDLASDFSLLVASRAVRDLPSYHQHGVGSLSSECDRAAPLEPVVSIVFLSSWADVDASIEKIGQALNEQALGEQVIVAVHQNFCPD